MKYVETVTPVLTLLPGRVAGAVLEEKPNETLFLPEGLSVLLSLLETIPLGKFFCLLKYVCPSSYLSVNNGKR